jgi:hypothetical protein
MRGSVIAPDVHLGEVPEGRRGWHEQGAQITRGELVYVAHQMDVLVKR